MAVHVPVEVETVADLQVHRARPVAVTQRVARSGRGHTGELVRRHQCPDGDYHGAETANQARPRLRAGLGVGTKMLTHQLLAMVCERSPPQIKHYEL